MPFAGRSRSATRTAVLAVCVLLAFAVFAWGLHAKLSLYSPGIAPSSQTVAKLLTAQENKGAVPAADMNVHPHAVWELLLFLLGSALVLPSVHVRWLALSHPRLQRVDWPVRPDILSRPPPSLSSSR